jgi:hypothetical protein
MTTLVMKRKKDFLVVVARLIARLDQKKAVESAVYCTHPKQGFTKSQQLSYTKQAQNNGKQSVETLIVPRDVPRFLTQYERQTTSPHAVRLAFPLLLPLKP